MMLLDAGTNINFPNLGIKLNDVGSSINIFGFSIAYYGIAIAIGMVVGYLVAEWQAKRTGQNKDLYLDFALYAIILSVIGARVYYVIFNWNEYKDAPLQILNIRNGGLAIYGGIITAVITAFVYTKIKKISFGLLADTAVLGLIAGQVIGRWGNFFNREAFGEYSNGLFAMQLNLKDVSSDYTMPVAQLAQKFAGKEQAYQKILEIRNNTVSIEGIPYIQVQPTFLYESVWNLVLLILLILYSRHKKFDGEVFLLYLFGYGLGRLWIEGYRTDQLFLFNTPLAVSQLLSGILVIAAAVVIVAMRRRKPKKTV